MFAKAFKQAVAACAFTVAVFVFAPANAAPAASGGCDTTATRFKVSITDFSTGSGSYVDIPETNVSFKQGGTRTGCVIVTFAAEARVSASQQMVVQATLDDAPCMPGDVSFVPNSTAGAGEAARSMTFVCINVEPGSHTVKMQFHITGSGTVTAGARTTTVQYLK